MKDKPLDPFLEKQWVDWQPNLPKGKTISDEDLRKALIDDLTMVSSMTVEEYTLFQKWCEIQENYPVRKVSTLFEGTQKQLIDVDDAKLIQSIKNNIWLPETEDDYSKLEPVLTYTTADDLAKTWNCIRTFISTMKNNANIGRNLNYLVHDNKTGKYLGVICISSDFLDLTPRDQYIKWDRHKKTQGHMINYTAIGSTIVPFQPLGYNYVGGKLLALLCLSDEVQTRWKKEYDDVLVGVTTTSLYGKNKTNGMSQYDGLKYWQKMGFTSGTVSYDPTRSTMEMMRTWLKENYPRKYFEWYVAKKSSGQPYKRDHKNRSNYFIYSKMDIPKNLTKSEHARGIYFSPLYDNTCEFLRGEIKEAQLQKSFDTSYKGLVDIWKTEYARPRIRMLAKRGRVSKETLFYDDLLYLDWAETKARYLSQVGR